MSRRRRGPGNILFNLVPIVLIIIMAVSGTLFMKDFLTYKAASDEYDALAEKIVVKEDASAADAGDTEAEEEKDYYPDLDIDYDSLEKINGDFAGVLYIPALKLRYPMAQSHDNAEYLTTTFNGEKNPSGSIFVDANAKDPFNDLNTIVYGHNMKNMTMFGSLKKFSADSSLCESDPYFYIYQKEKTRRYRIIAYFTISNTDSMYNNFTDETGYDAYIAKISKISQYQPGKDAVDYAQYPKLVTLSTCWGTGHKYNFVVVGALEAEKSAS